MEQLRELALQVERHRKLMARNRDLRNQLDDLEKKARELKHQWSKEQQDVEKLQSFSLSGLLYELLGKKEEKLEQEQREALAAAAKYQAAAAEIDAVKREFSEVQTEWQVLQGCTTRYEQAKKERAERLKAEDPVAGPQIAALEEELARIESQRRELLEALEAGRRALSTARAVQSELDSAENWGTWDMLGGGGLLTQMAKNDHLDSAQSCANSLQNQLRHFRTELADVQIQAHISIQIDEFLRFADWFFDGLIVDWTVQSKIHDAQDQIYQTICQIQRLLDRLDGLKSDLLRREDQVREQLDALVLSHE